MAENEDIIARAALKTLEIEAKAIKNLGSSINDDFIACVKAIFHCKGRVVLTGIGKSAIIAAKIAATLNSTGTPALLLHAADAIHGDLGMVQEDDIVICLSKSGETPEIKVLVPLLKNNNNLLASIVGNNESFLAKQSDFVLDVTVPEEACPNNLAPTASTTAQLAMGDALAISLLELKGFTAQDFAKFHPGGVLGKKLYLKVSDIYVNNTLPKVEPDADIKSVIIEITSNRLGATAVINSNNSLAGIITDGDIRRMLEHDFSIKSTKAKDIMGSSPKSINKTELAVNALSLMRQNNITQLIVLDDNNVYIGMIHLHDLIKEGIV